MQVIETKNELRSALRSARLNEQTIGLVPTMGALHQGHLSLVERARKECSVVVVSLFVNPTQFNDPADLRNYPRTTTADKKLAEQSGVDFLFMPSTEELYGEHSHTKVVVSDLTDTLCGQYRGSKHFSGVATVVTKLLNIARPDRAYFGEKDFQQLQIIRQLVFDLDLETEIIGCPTIRESDGLAQSSRNLNLSADQRVQAQAIYRSLESARTLASQGITSSATLKAAAAQELTSAALKPEYIELVASDTLKPVDEVKTTAVLAVAAYVGDTRLIDNTEITLKGVQ